MTRFIALTFVVLLVACMREAEMPTEADGLQVFQDNCVMCHGSGGKGDGDAAQMMSPRPPDLTRIALRNRGVFPRAEVLSMIDGYTRPDVAGVDMPEFGDLLMGDTVPVDVGDGVLTPTPRPLAALMLYLEAIQK